MQISPKVLTEGGIAGYSSSTRTPGMNTDNYEGMQMRTKARFVFSLAVGCLMALPVSLPLARSAGREYSRCINACNVARSNCEDRCRSDCAAAFPTSASQRRACESACHAICVTQEQDCKDHCRANKKNDTPEEP